MIRETLEEIGANYSWYRTRRAEYETGQRIPFRVSPQPYRLTPAQTSEMFQTGAEIVQFLQAADELYRTESEVHALLSKGKPGPLRGVPPSDYLFVRPDMVIADGGRFTICELETSPFGLALAELLNRGYQRIGFDTLVANQTLTNYIRSTTFDRGTIVFNHTTASYEGQMQFLAKEVFSSADRSWQAVEIDAYTFADAADRAVYRAFYLAEYMEDLFLHSLIDQGLLAETQLVMLPSVTPHMEEKALMALLWDWRWESFFKAQLGEVALQHLREVVPPTWVVGYERYFASALPNGINNSLDLASLHKSQRQWVLKESGFSRNGSWSEGVKFLHEISANKAYQLLLSASQDQSRLYIIQKFNRGIAQQMVVEDEQTGEAMPMAARIRLTPYFSMARGKEGTLIAIKATGCEHTNYIHASSASINVAVSEERGYTKAQL